MQGHLRCQERLWMWILRSQESGAGEFDFDCYPTESMHFASFSYEHDSRKSRENCEFWQLGNSFASPNPKKRLKIRNNNIDELIDPKNRFIFEPLSANMSVGDQCRSWVLGPMLQWPGEHWVVLFYFGWFRNRLMEILGFALTVSWQGPFSHIFTMSTMAAHGVAVLGSRLNPKVSKTFLIYTVWCGQNKRSSWALSFKPARLVHYSANFMSLFGGISASRLPVSKQKAKSWRWRRRWLHTHQTVTIQDTCNSTRSIL